MRTEIPVPTRPRRLCRLIVAGPIALGLITGLALPARAQATTPTPAPIYPGRYPFTPADVHFISGMIGHHAQAIVMAGWAPSHGASQSVRTLCERIINAQTDEITLMQNWLKDRHQPVPDAKAGPMKMMMDGVEHEMLMPGMLTDEQMKQLNQANGTEFDRLFLRLMIQHHQGAITMVNQLFATPGAGQDEAVFKFASDVNADQSTEVDRMQKMLITLLGK
jgi:uncharacterized protein (DUF305 family)